MRIAPYVRATAVTYDPQTGLVLKWESQQETGAYKPRGALNKILQLSTAQRSAGLVAASAGNHGQGVALAAQVTGSRARVFVPGYAPEIKVEKMRAREAEVIVVAGGFGEAEQAAQADAAARGAVYVSAYNDAAVVTGAGTIALDWLQQTPDLARVLIPLGGGGLLTGMGMVLRQLRPEVEVVGVQSEASAYLYHQFYDGHMRAVVEQPTLTDGLAGDVEIGITTEYLRQVCDRVVLVSEAEVAAGMRYIGQRLGEVVEGSAAVGVAAVLAGKIGVDDRVTGALITGKNIDPRRWQEIMGV